MILRMDADLAHYSDADYEADLHFLPAQRRDKALQYRRLADRKRCVKAYMLLWEILSSQFGIKTPPVFSFGPYGKPYLKENPKIHFSLSHTETAVLCAVDRSPVGADIETIRSLPEQLLPFIFSNEQQEKIQTAEDPVLAFWKYWTRKESCLKLSGEGLTNEEALQCVPIEDTGEIHFETVISEKDRIVYSVCSAKANEGKNSYEN